MLQLVMNRHYIQDYVVKELRKCCDQNEEPNDEEGMLLSCLFQELLRKVLIEAQLQAQADGSREIKPYHLHSALESIADGS